ncbi:MAG: hypothetical protein ACK5NK_04735 [Niabella sp.]
MEFILFTIYLFLFTWVVTQTRFFVNSGIPVKHLAMLFLLKVIVAIIYGWIGIYDGTVASMSDTWYYHFESLKETQLLFANPKEYFLNIFQFNATTDLQSFFASSNSYWNNLKLNAFIKILSVFNCFSFGNYYINAIFYNYILFWGVVAIYKLMLHHLKATSFILIIACFLIPSFLYWCSGLHKDGITFLSVAIIIYHFYFYITAQKAGWRNYLWLLLGLFLLFVFRNYILIALVPALFAWYIANKWPLPAKRTFLVIYIIGIILFFGLPYLHPSLNFPAFVVSKQQAFISLTGGKTSIPVTALEPNAISFLKNLPQAISLSFIRPYFSDAYKPIILPALIENIAIMLCLLLAIFVRKRNLQISSFGLFIVFFSITMYLIIGYTVNNLGATVRYRSFILPLYMPFILTAINCKKLWQIININKK